MSGKPEDHASLYGSKLEDHASQQAFKGSDRTRLRILQAIKEPIEDMTVSEICALAGVSRQTFYSLFSSKYDIAYWYLLTAEELFVFPIGRTLTLEEGLTRFFTFLDEEHASLSCAFERNPPKPELRQRLSRPESEFLWTIQSLGIEPSEDLKFCLVYTVESANCLVASWCIHGMDEPPKRVAKRLAMCIPSCLTDLVSKGLERTLQNG